jgi:hypothetical protein
MRKFSTVILTLSLFSSYSFGFGGVVTDPSSYTYYVEQIKAAKEQLKTAQQQFEEMEKTKDGVLNIQKNVTGNLLRAQKSLSNIAALKDQIKKNPKDFLEYSADALDDITKVDKYRADVTDNLNDTFGLEGDNAIGGWGDVKAEKTKPASQQRAAKNAIVGAEVAKGKIAVQLDDIEALSTAANTATSLKDSSDINNALLAKIALNQQEVIKLLADISQNISLYFYEGKENVDKVKASMVNGKDLLSDSDFKPNTSTNKPLSMSERGKKCNPFAGECDKGEWQ